MKGLLSGTYYSPYLGEEIYWWMRCPEYLPNFENDDDAESEDSLCPACGGQQIPVLISR